MSKKTVAVIFGGRSTEHEISKISAANIISVLDKEKYFVLPVYIKEDGTWLLYEDIVDNLLTIQWDKFGTPAQLSPDCSHGGLIRLVGNKAKIIPIDIVFPVMHGKNGEDGTIQGLCELANIPYVGCSVLSSSVSMDKSFTNLLAKSLGINQAHYITTTREEILENVDKVTKNISSTLGYPCFVKPANAGSSLGVSKAKNKKELLKALDLAIMHDRKVVVESTIVGRELECAVLGNYEPKASSVGEVLAAADFYDFDAKYNNAESKTIVPADIPSEIADEIRELSIKIFKAVDGSGLSRVDFFLEEGTNKVMFNEINTMPGFTTISLYPSLWNEQGVTTSELVDLLIELGFERFNSKEQTK